MTKTEDVVVPVVCVAIVLLLACIQIPLTGFGPLWAKKIWTKIIRFWKRGDKRPWDWTPVEEGVIYLSTLPRSAAELQELQGPPHNVGAVVSLNEGWEIVMGKEELDPMGIEWLHLPTPDYSAPDLHTVLRGVRFIDAQVKAGRGVLVHCNAGKGRSVVVTLSFLLLRHYAEGWDAAQAFDFVKEKRKVANMRARCGTHPQWRSVRSFGKVLRKHHGRLPEIREPARPAPVATVVPVAPEGEEHPGPTQVVEEVETGGGREGDGGGEEHGVTRDVARLEGPGEGGAASSAGEEMPREWRGAASFSLGREGGSGRQVVCSPREKDGGAGESAAERPPGGGGEILLPGTPYKDGGAENRLSDEEEEAGKGQPA